MVGDDGPVPAASVWALVAAAAGWYLTGLAVTVALVVYPGFARVGADRWADHHRRHQSAITVAVAPAWAAEGIATVGWLVAAVADGGPAVPLALVHAVAAGATVALTVAAAVPRHTALAGGFDPVEHRRLTAAHRWRTVAWAAAAAVATAGTLG